MDNLIVRVVDALCVDVGTPRALTVHLLVHAGEWAQLQELRCRPSDYQDSESYWRDSVVTELLRKCDLPTTVDKKGAAVQTFYDCEVANCATNARLSRFLPESLYLEEQDDRVADFISLWRKEIKYVLGNLPDHLTPRFSGGATFADTGFLITTPDKMSSRPTIYQGSRDLLPFWTDTSWFRALADERPWNTDPRTVRGNIFFTVPKDGTKFRGCCKEASLPVSLQLDVGRVLKSRLLRIGIDLRAGQMVHRQLAREASITNLEATIDMSNASDTLCRVLPRLVLPGQWWELLNSLRATHTRIDGKWVRLEKFSSMGNGFTFELESLIFSTLARVLVREEGGDPDRVKCYGDDLIVPGGHYRSVVAALRLFGFQPNMKKTFAEGPFRESCGGDFWNGTPVRAHYIEELPDEPQHWISLANGLRRVARGDGCPASRWATVRRAWLRAMDPIPSNIRRCTGPESLGDVVIHDNPETWRTFNDPENPSWGLQFVKAYQPVPEVLPWHHWTPATQLASCTLGLPARGITPRGGVSGYRIAPIALAGTGGSWLPSNRRREPPRADALERDVGYRMGRCRSVEKPQ